MRIAEQLRMEEREAMGRRVLIGVGILVLVILAAGGGFVYGTSVGERRARQTRLQPGQRRFGAQEGQFAPPAFQQGQAGGNILGTIDTVEGDTLIVSTEDGPLHVQTTDTTLIQKYSSVDVTALQAGDQVMISGSRADEGTITARSIRALQWSQMVQPDQP
jgi:hypothetical protein